MFLMPHLDIKEDSIDDAVAAGNFNVLFPLLNRSILENKAIPEEVRKRVVRSNRRIQKYLIDGAFTATFGKE